MIDMGYLQQLGLEQRLEDWRDAQSNPEATKFETVLQRATATAKAAEKTAHPPSDSASPAHSFAPAEVLAKPTMVRDLLKWLGVGLATSLALVLMARIEAMRLETLVEKTRAQEAAERAASARQSMAMAVAPANAVESPKPAPAPQTRPAIRPASILSPVPPRDPAAKAFDAVKLEAIFLLPSILPP